MDEPLQTTPDELSTLASHLFQGGATKYRLMQKYRPYICPYDVLLEHVPEHSSVLDVGCGGGLFLGLLAGMNRIDQGYGFDSSSAAIETANTMAQQAKSSGHDTKLTFEVRSADADWPGQTYDVVSLIDVMHHVPPEAHQSVIENAIGRVKPGGIFIYKDMCQRPVWRALANRMHDLVLAREWINYLSITDVMNWSEAQGLALKHRSNNNLLWYGHELVVFSRPTSD